LRLSICWSAVLLCLVLMAGAYATTDTSGPLGRNQNAPQDYYSAALGNMSHDAPLPAVSSTSSTKPTEVSSTSYEVSPAISARGGANGTTADQSTSTQTERRASGRSFPPSVPQLPPTLLVGALPLFGLVVSRLRRR